MRLNSNFYDQSASGSMVGTLLLAHPQLQDPNFARSVILLTAHTSEEGALGLVLNRPLSRKLVDLKPELFGQPFCILGLMRLRLTKLRRRTPHMNYAPLWVILSRRTCRHRSSHPCCLEI